LNTCTSFDVRSNDGITKGTWLSPSSLSSSTRSRASRSGLAECLLTHPLQQTGTPALREHSGPELHIEVDDLQRGQPRAETNCDEPACRGADDQVEVLDDGGVAVHLELGEDRRREQPTQTATIECEDLEPARPCACYGSRIGVGFGELTAGRHLVSSGQSSRWIGEPSRMRWRFRRSQ
jgi:hypothetical protein